ncbi:MAG TPA: right-handed parallel beta-helix repeat-containing protein [Blastocatellia bacterium]|nr:right-handed parallel beta-helix repeat-containing protein [Blastocatellia bacterium]
MQKRFSQKIITFSAIILASAALAVFSASSAASQHPRAAALDEVAALDPLVFDVSYYKLVNPDLSGLTDSDAQSHWLNQGVAEGRRAHPLFWTQQYLAYYPDLQAAFGPQNYAAALEHYVSTGHTEGRAGVLALAPTVFDVQYYKQVNPDLAAMPDTDAETHWIEHGISENRHAHPRFYAPDYLFLNYDKALQFGTSGGVDSVDDYALNGANDHQYVFSSSGRIGLDALMPLVFDPAYYMARHPELNFQSADDATTYWLRTGLDNGDKGSSVFSAREYLEQYPDLAQAFGPTAYRDALEHYVRTGRSEGRSGLFAIDQSYLSQIPASAGLTTTPADRVETFTSVTGQTITVTIQAPAPAADTTYTMRPINPGEPPDDYFPLAVANAQAAGAGTLLIPRDVYNFQGTNPDSQWVISNLTDMTIDGQGSVLNFSKPEAAIDINGVTRVDFKNFVIDWPNLPIASLGTIVADPNDPSQTQHLLQMDPAYPFDPSRSIEALSPWDVAGNTWGRQTQIEDAFSTGGSNGNPPPVYLGNLVYSSPDFAAMPIGTALLVRYYVGEGTAMLIGGAQDFALDNVTVHSAPGAGFFFANSRGVRISNCVVDRSSGKLISATSGALQFNDNAGDVLVENSVFAYQGDDGINLGAASFFPVQAVNGNQLTLAQADSIPVAGDPVVIFNSAFGVLGYSSISSVTQNPDGGFGVSLNDQIPHLDTDCWLGRLNYMGARWIVRNNEFLNSHARAILPQTPFGLLENNIMRGLTQPPILAGIINDVPPAVGPGVQDMQVLNNQISDSGSFSPIPPVLRGGTSPGAIVVESQLINGVNLFDESQSTDVPINQQIMISGNTIQNVPGPGIFIGSASKITVSGNQIIDAGAGGSYYLGTANTSGSIVISQSHDISLSGNTTSGDHTGPISIDSHSTNQIDVSAGPDFSLGFDRSTVTTRAGARRHVTVNINRSGGFTGQVTVVPPPAAAGIKVAPPGAITTTGVTVAFKLKISRGTTPGVYQLIFKGMDDSGRERDGTLSLVVQQ